MWTIILHAWRILGTNGGTMPTPADLPPVRAVMVPLAQLTDDDWTDVFHTILPEWRRHRRCGTSSACYRRELDRFDYLLDEWLQTHPAVNTVHAAPSQ